MHSACASHARPRFEFNPFLRGVCRATLVEFMKEEFRGQPVAPIDFGDCDSTKARHDPVNSPSHYRSKAGRFEAIDVIEEFELGYHLGNAIKYILRAGKKGELSEDLEKARWYLARAIEQDGK